MPRRSRTNGLMRCLLLTALLATSALTTSGCASSSVRPLPELPVDPPRRPSLPPPPNLPTSQAVWQMVCSYRSSLLASLQLQWPTLPQCEPSTTQPAEVTQ